MRACTGPVLCGIARGAQRSFRYAYRKAAAAAVCCADPVRQYWRIAGHRGPGRKSAAAEQIKQRGSIMWVYQQTGTQRALARSCASAAAAENAAAQNNMHRKCLHRCSIIRKPGRKPCWLFVCLSDRLWLAGVLLAFCEKQQPDWLQYYLQSWRGLFAAADAHTAASLFGMEYLTLTQATTLLFLMGFSALGPVFNLFVYDVLWAGKRDAVCAAAFRHGAERETWLLLLAFLPAAAASAGLCTLAQILCG